MAYLAIRGSGGVNAVSRLHRRSKPPLFQPLFPRWPSRKFRSATLTNGVHMPSWASAAADAVWTQAAASAVGPARWRRSRSGIRSVPDARSSGVPRNVSRRALVDFARERLSHDLARVRKHCRPRAAAWRDTSSIPTH